MRNEEWLSGLEAYEKPIETTATTTTAIAEANNCYVSVIIASVSVFIVGSFILLLLGFSFFKMLRKLNCITSPFAKKKKVNIQECKKESISPVKFRTPSNSTFTFQTAEEFKRNSDIKEVN